MSKRRNNSGGLFVGFLAVATVIVIVALSLQKDQVGTNSNNSTNAPVNAASNLDAVGGGEIEAGNLDSGYGSNVSTDEPSSAFSGTQTYTNAEFGIRVSGLTYAKETVSGDISTIDFGGLNSLSVVTPDLEGIVRESVGAESETPVIIDGVAGVEIHGSSAKDGSPRTLILVEHNNSVFVFDGSQEFLAALPSHVQFE